MKHDELDPLPDILAKEFDAERARVDADPIMKDAVLRNVERAVMLAGPAPGVAAPDPPAHGAPAPHASLAGAGHLLTTKALGLVVAASFAAGALTGGMVIAASHPEPRPSPSVATKDADAGRVAAASSSPAASGSERGIPVVEASVVAPPVGSVDANDAGRAPVAISIAPVGGVDLSRERELIDVARAALARGRADVALEAVERHRRSFPTGKLREERDAVGVQALLAAGRREEAEEAAKRFHRSYPSSLMSELVDSAIAPPRRAP